MGDILSDRVGLSLTELEGLMITDPGVIETVGLADPAVGLADPDGVTVGVRDPVGVRDALRLTELVGV